MHMYDANTILTDDETYESYRGVNSYNIIYNLADIGTYDILPEDKFRPDKISFTLYGTPDLFWLLDDLNNFKHGIKEYVPGKTIKYYSRDVLISNGLL